MANPLARSAAPWTEHGAIDLPDGVLAYAAAGQGEPLVLLHKLGGWIADWRRLVPYLTDRYRVIAFDLPGHGDSSWKEPATWEFSLESAGRAVVAGMLHLGIERASIVGNSLGGCDAAWIAAHLPAHLDKLALISVAMGDGRTIEDIQQADERPDSFYDAEGKPRARDAAEVARISGTRDVRIAEEMNLSRAKAGRWVMLSERGVGLTHFPVLLPHITAPVLLLYGERDHLQRMFRERAETMIPNAQTVIIPDSGRFPHMEQPQATADALIAFLTA